MNAKDVFGVVVRTAGLFLLVYGLWYLLYGVAQATGISPITHSTVNYFLSGWGSLLVGLYFLRGAPGLLRFCYPDKSRKNEDNSIHT